MRGLSDTLTAQCDTIDSAEQTMFEIKVLYCAQAGCIGSQNHAPASLTMCSSLFKGINMLEKHAHTGGTCAKICAHYQMKCVECMFCKMDQKFQRIIDLTKKTRS